MKVAYLKITTWVNSYAVMAEHYYGEIIFGDNQWSKETPKEEVEYAMSYTEAVRMNKSDSMRMIPFNLKRKEGDKSGAFKDRDRLIEEAIKLFKKDSKGFNVLLEGGPDYIDPHKMLIGPENMTEKANKIYEQFESYNGWGCEPSEEKIVQSISNDWSDITGLYKEYRSI